MEFLLVSAIAANHKVNIYKQVFKNDNFQGLAFLLWKLFRSLQRTLNELKEYQKQHDHYLRQQEILEKHKLIQEEQILRNIIHETQMAKEAQLGE